MVDVEQMDGLDEPLCFDNDVKVDGCSDGEVVGSADAAEVNDVVFGVYDVHLDGCWKVQLDGC